MCGRFALTLPLDAMAQLFDAPAPRAPASTLLAPRHNIRPTETIWSVRLSAEGDRVLSPMRWGFTPPWRKRLDEGPPLINARSETIAEKPAFREACRQRRCLIPADGFYEWRTTPGETKKPVKQPFWIAPADAAPLVFAGVWTLWAGGPEATPIETVAIVTCAANEALRPLHERLPVAIAPDAFGLWLGQEGHGAARLMRTPDDAFYAAHPVGPEINKGGREAPDHAGLRTPISLDAAAGVVPGSRDAGDDLEPRLL